MAAAVHMPVLLQQVLHGLAPQPGGVFIDGTVGLGGHAAALLETPATRLVGLDLDPEALRLARERLAPFGGRATLLQESYWKIDEVVASQGLSVVDGVLLDLGVSSLQLDTPERGFSFRQNAPLDMRFSNQGPTAAEWLGRVAEDELVRALHDFGEEPRARRVARAILWARERGPITTTGELRRAVVSALGHGGRIDPATRTFQAVRIAVNRELEGLPGALEAAARLLRPGGRLAVISFHSLEDRIVKLAFRRLSGRCICPPGMFPCQCHPEELVEIVTRKPIEADADEVAANPRARSAKLRVAARRPT
jgi:16S rRNA (cytosine1402-N4)-methyltransferase